jgi:hypothetical protein
MQPDSMIHDGGGMEAPPDDAPALDVNMGQTGNLLQNPSCENGVNPWFAFGGSLESSTALVYTGIDAGTRHSCHSFNRTSGNGGSSFNGPAQDVSQVLHAGSFYNVSAYALWIRPSLIPDGGGMDAGSEAGSSDAAGDGPRDASVSEGGSSGGSSSGGGLADAGPGMQGIFITLKLDCTSNAVDAATIPTNFIRIATANPNLQEGQWTQVIMSGFSGPGCLPGYTRMATLYIEGPNAGIDLFVDDVTLTAQ